MTDLLLRADNIGDTLLKWVVGAIPALNNLNPWIFFVIMVAAAVILSQITAWVLRVIVKGITSRTKTEADDIIVDAVQQPLAWIIFSVLLYVAFAPLQLGEATKILVSSIMAAINIFFVAWLFHRLVNAIMNIWKTFAKDTTNTVDDTMLPIVSKFLKAVVWIVGGLMVLATWGVEIGPFLAGLGIAGIAIGFAVKDSLANIFGGISLALDNAYKIGDKVRLGDGTVGIVYDITLRSTRIKTYDGDLVMVPNGVIANENIYTFAQPDEKSRIQVDFGVEYGSDPDKVIDLVMKVIAKMDGILTDPQPSVVFHNMGAYALEMRAYFWVPVYTEAWGKKMEATKGIYNALNKSKIGIPFPTQTLHIKK